MEIKIMAIPIKQVVDYEAIAEWVLKNGPMLVSPDINKNSFHAMLHKYGLGVYNVGKHGPLIRAQPVPPANTHHYKPATQ